MHIKLRKKLRQFTKKEQFCPSKKNSYDKHKKFPKRNEKKTTFTRSSSPPGVGTYLISACPPSFDSASTLGMLCDLVMQHSQVFLYFLMGNNVLFSDL